MKNRIEARVEANLQAKAHGRPSYVIKNTKISALKDIASASIMTSSNAKRLSSLSRFPSIPTDMTDSILLKSRIGHTQHILQARVLDLKIGTAPNGVWSLWKLVQVMKADLITYCVWNCPVLSNGNLVWRIVIGLLSVLMKSSID